jgi:hypothetical protein
VSRMKRKRIPKNKPLVKMTGPEFTQTFDDLGESLTRAILADARKADSDVVLALAVLDIPGVGSRIATFDPEYGDGEGTAHIDDFVRVCHQRNLLEPGETLRRLIWRAAVGTKERTQ